MKVPLGWLREYVAIELPVSELVRKLTFAGLEVEAVDFVGVAPHDQRIEAKVGGLAWDPERVVVGEVVEVRPHPDADRLVVARVDDGRDTLESVTGAPNLFPFQGAGPLERPLKVAVARPGARLIDPGSGALRELKRGAIRGVDSACMLCSERELGIADLHEGVLVMDDDPVAPGTPLAEHLGDVVLDLSITPNMVRNASLLGVAREVAALAGAQLELPDASPRMEGPPVAEKIRIDIRRPELNPRFTATLLEGAEVGPSPYWLQLRLMLAGQRPISNLVDVTNYVMLETGQPLHAFDYDVLAERSRGAGAELPTIITRLPEAGEKLTTLDGVERRLDDFTVLVADPAGALSLGGIMGGADSEISDATTSVLLEAAAWDFINIRRTVLAQQIPSEAGYRFSRGVHPEQAGFANLRAIELMRRLAGGTICAGMVDEHPAPAPPVPVELPYAEIERALGVAIPGAEAAAILRALEFEVVEGDETLTATAPGHRLDIGEGVVGVADLIEEVSRIWGYERIPETQIEDAVPPQRANPQLEAEERVRDLLVELGLQEVITYRLTTPEREARALPAGSPPDERPWVELQNPISEERRVMRHELLPSLLEIAEANARHRGSLALFEIGAVYLPRDGETLPDEPRRLALLMAGERAPAGFERPQPEAFDFFDLKGLLDELAGDLHLPAVAAEATDDPRFHPGRCGALTIDGRAAGLFGELHPEVRAAYELPWESVLAADLDFEALAAALPDRWAARELPRFPPVVEDLAFVVAEGVTAGTVEAAIRSAGGDLLRAVELFDLYRGEPLAAGAKSLAYRLTYQSDERTLTDDEVAAVRRRIVKKVERDLGARLRS